MSRKILASIFSFVLAFALFGSQASAAEAEKLIVELSKHTATAFDDVIETEDYIRGRVVAVDADGAPATTIGGADINGQAVTIASNNFAGKVDISADSADTAKGDVDFTNVSVAFDANGIAEFIVKYSGGADGPATFKRAAGASDPTDYLNATAGTLSTTSGDITIAAPVSNRYVIRTGANYTAPSVNDEIGPPNEDGRADIDFTPKKAGDAVVVNVFAAFYDGSDYYFTDNVPSEYKLLAIMVTSRKMFTFGPIFYGPMPPVFANLVNGKDVLTWEHTKDLKILDQLTNASIMSGASPQKQMDLVKDIMQNGAQFWFQPISATSRLVGSDVADGLFGADLDITADDEVNISMQQAFGNTQMFYMPGFGPPFYLGEDCTKDSARIYPKPLSKVRVTPLPVNALGGKVVTSITPTGIMDTGDLSDISPADLVLAGDYTDQSSVFNTYASPVSETFVYGAIIGLDAHNNLTPFNQTGKGTTFSLSTGSGTVISKYGSGTIVNQAVADAYEPFVPFCVTATSATDMNVADVDSMYINKYEVEGESEQSTSEVAQFADINSAEESISLYGKAFVDDLVFTPPGSASTVGLVGSRSWVEIAGISGTVTETLWNVSFFKSTGLKPSVMDINTVQDEAKTSVDLQASGGSVDETTLYNFTSVEAGDNALAKVAGKDELKGYAVWKPVSFTHDLAADTISTGAISANQIMTVNTLVDANKNHDTLIIDQTSIIDQLFAITDIWGNTYPPVGFTNQVVPMDGLTLEFLDKDGNKHPALARIEFVDDGKIKVLINTNDINSENSKATLKVSTSTSSAQVTVNLNPVQQVAMSSPFIPLMNPISGPIKTYFASSNPGGMLQPVWDTEHTVNITGTDATALPASVALRFDYPFNYFRATLAADKETGTLAGKATDFADGTLALEAEKEYDTTPPELVEFNAINCGFQFVLKDDRSGVSHDLTTVEIYDEDFKDVTADFDAPVFVDLLMADNDTSKSTQVTVTGDIDPDIYTIYIDAFDIAENYKMYERTREVTECEVPVPSCSVEPAFMVAGETETVVVTVENFPLDTSTAVSFACADVTINGDIVVDAVAGTITFEATVADNAIDQDCAITVATGTITPLECAFEIFAAPQYTIAVSADPEAGGTVTGGGTFDEGEEITVEATANEGYVFVNWTEDGTEVSSDASFTFTVDADRTLVANFEPGVTEYTVAVSADPAAGGTVTGGGTYEEGTSVTVSATANTGYQFVNWTEDGTEVSTSLSYTFNVDADITLVANFELIPVPTCELTITPEKLMGGWLLPRFAVISMKRDDGQSFATGDSVVYGSTKLANVLAIPVFDTMYSFAILWPGQAEESGVVSVTIGDCEGEIDIEYSWLP